MKRKSLPTGRDFLFVEGYGNENPGAFQSTRPLRGATCLGVTRAHYIKFQPTRPLRGATGDLCIYRQIYYISTHAPLAGRDRSSSRAVRTITHFNPRAPCGARRHTLSGSTRANNFNPRAPCGARPRRSGSIRDVCKFQPTRPLRGATAKVYKSLCTFLR